VRKKLLHFGRHIYVCLYMDIGTFIFKYIYAHIYKYMYTCIQGIGPAWLREASYTSLRLGLYAPIKHLLGIHLVTYNRFYTYEYMYIYMYIWVWNTSYTSLRLGLYAPIKHLLGIHIYQNIYLHWNVLCIYIYVHIYAHIRVWNISYTSLRLGLYAPIKHLLRYSFKPIFVYFVIYNHARIFCTYIWICMFNVSHM
jgi:uncharacterized ubiquitin-like protein YukD